MTHQEEQAADIAAKKFNDAVWSSPNLIEAIAHMDEAREELKTGHGWGMVALESSKEHLRSALSAIDRLVALKESA